MPFFKLCGWCHDPYPEGETCQCEGARAARVRANVRKHTNNQRAGRYGSHWKHVRLATMRRDGYRCVICGRHKTELQQNERLTVHLDPRLKSDHEAATVADCDTRCSTCHGSSPKPSS